MSRLLHRLPGAVADSLRVLVPDARECRGIAGRFNLDRLKSESVTTPGILVSILDLKQVAGAAGPIHFFDLSMAAFVVTKDQLGLKRDESAAIITTAIAAYVPDSRWGESACGEARDVRGQSVVTSGFLKSAASLWAVTWTQPCTIDASEVSAPVDLQLFVGQAPHVGAASEDDYVQIGGAS
jgi:hypothetical protein